MEKEKINFKEIKNIELKDIINEYLVNSGIVAIDYNANLTLEDFTFGQNYKFMYAKDIDIYFEKVDEDKQYPIKMTYETTYTHQVITIDYITEEFYKKEIKGEKK